MNTEKLHNNEDKLLTKLLAASNNLDTIEKRVKRELINPEDMDIAKLRSCRAVVRMMLDQLDKLIPEETTKEEGK